MSFGTHRIWKKKLVDMINIQNREKILDIGCGTGDISIEVLNRKKNTNMFLGDLNLSMIEEGKRKNIFKKNKVNWININAEELPFNNNFFDKYIISFCLRNVTNIQKTLEESFRVLKDGGEFFCMEFSKVNQNSLNNIYNIYKNNLIPLMGKLVTKKMGAYNYLAESIDTFPNQDLLQKSLTKIGYFNVTYYNLFGGIVSIHKGWKI